MKTKFISIIGLIMICLTSCQPNTNYQVLELDPNDADIKLSLPDIAAIPDSSIHYSDIFSSVRYLFLESRSYVTLSTISQIEKTNNHDYIIFDAINKLIVRYDSCGNFLNLVGDRGNGHNEYNHPTFIAYDKYTDEVIVQDNGSRSIKFFTIHGDFIRSFDAPSWHCALRVVDESHLLFYFDYFSEGKGYNYCITDKNGKVCFWFEKIPENINMSVLPSVMNTFFYDGDELCCLSESSNIVYSVSSKRVTPKCFISPQEGVWGLGNPFDFEDNWKKIFSKNRIEFFIVSQNRLLVTFSSTKGYRISRYTNQMGASFWFTNIHNDIDQMVSSSNWRTIIDDEIYTQINPELFEDKVKRKNLSRDEDAFIDKFSKSINPIIQVCKLK